MFLCFWSGFTLVGSLGIRKMARSSLFVLFILFGLALHELVRSVLPKDGSVLPVKFIWFGFTRVSSFGCLKMARSSLLNLFLFGFTVHDLVRSVA